MTPLDPRCALLQRRIVLIGQAIDHAVASEVASQLVVLGRGDIHLIVNASGGSVGAALAIRDAIRATTSKVATWAIGRAEGPAALVVASGAAGERRALPHSRFRLGPLDEPAGLSRDVETGAAEVKRLRADAFARLAAATGRPEDECARLVEAREVLDAQGARALGLVDEVVASLPPGFPRA